MAESKYTTDLTNLSLSDIGSVPSIPSSPQPVVRQLRAAKPSDKRGWWWGTGRRKTAVARIRMKPASGEAGITIETKTGKVKSVEQYFSEERDRVDATAALKATNLHDKLQVVAKISGGGYMGQAQALRLAIARALRDYDPTTEAALREAGFLTRDSRKVERKKYGQAGARRRFQFSKR
ncbi:MAG: 30S ribosomal protein S9 [Phycisphaerae bacterium]|nr:30S ribosomal protein S9 [Phycisphaerae bacterium]